MEGADEDVEDDLPPLNENADVPQLEEMEPSDRIIAAANRDQAPSPEREQNQQSTASSAQNRQTPVFSYDDDEDEDGDYYSSTKAPSKVSYTQCTNLEELD